MSADAVGFCRV